MTGGDDQLGIERLQAPEVGGEVLLPDGGDLDLQLDARVGGERLLGARLDRPAPAVVGDDRADTGEALCLGVLQDRPGHHRSRRKAGAERVAAVAGEDGLRAGLDEEQRHLGLFGHRAVPSPTSLEITPPTATTPSSMRRSIWLMPSSAFDWSSATTSSSGRPSTPPSALISSTASRMPSWTWMPHGAKVPVKDVRTPIRIGSPSAAVAAASCVGVASASSAVAVASCVGVASAWLPLVRGRLGLPGRGLLCRVARLRWLRWLPWRRNRRRCRCTPPRRAARRGAARGVEVWWIGPWVFLSVVVAGRAGTGGLQVRTADLRQRVGGD